MKSLFYLSINIFLLIGCIFSQNRYRVTDAERELIEESLKARLNSKCGINSIVFIDSVLKPLDSNDGGFEDPGGILSHCYVLIFSRMEPKTDADAKSSVGIYKKNKIIALLDTTIESSTCRIKTIADINNDGEVEIVVAIVLGISTSQWERYWIFSWNGKRLRSISKVDDERGHSILKSPWNYLKYIDIDCDGIYELVTSFEDEEGIEREHIYSWNGKLYGEWGKGSKTLLKESCYKKK